MGRPVAISKLVAVAARVGSSFDTSPRTFSPKPTISQASLLPASPASANTPPTLRKLRVTPPSILRTTKSFGHFRPTVPICIPAASSIASATASENSAAMRHQRSASAGSGEPAPARTARLIKRPVPGASSHVRPRRPRPALCVSARISSGVSAATAPAASRACASSLVESTALSRSMAIFVRATTPRRRRLALPGQTHRAAPAARAARRTRSRCR